MRRRAVIGSLLVSMWAAGAIGTGSAEEVRTGEPVNGLQAVLSPLETKYTLSQPVRISCTLRNVGAKPFRIFPWYKPLQPPLISVTVTGPLNVDFTKLEAEEKERRWPLRDSQGRLLEAKVEPSMQGAYSDSELIVLQPGQAWNVVDDLSAYYRIEKAGRYLVRVEYSSDRGTQLRLPDEWYGTVRSNELTIEVAGNVSRGVPGMVEGVVDKRVIGGLKLVVRSPNGEVLPVDDEGKFQFHPSDAKAALLNLQDDHGELRALAFYFPQQAQPLTFNAQTTAAAAILQTSGFVNQDPQAVEAFLKKIEQEACFSDLVLYLTGKLLTTSVSQLNRTDAYTTLLARCVTQMLAPTLHAESYRKSGDGH